MGPDIGQLLSNISGFIFIFIVIMVVIFLICREIVCWYFKINSIIALLADIRDLLAKGQSPTGSTSIAPMSGAGQVGPVPRTGSFEVLSDDLDDDLDIITLSKEIHLKEGPGDWARTMKILGIGIKVKIIKRNPDGWVEVDILNGSDPYRKEGWIKIS